MRSRTFCVSVAALVLLAGGATAQAPKPPCEDEVRALRFLVQKYSSDRAQLEFALAPSEARRQAAEAEAARLKSAPGQNPAAK